MPPELKILFLLRHIQLTNVKLEASRQAFRDATLKRERLERKLAELEQVLGGFAHVHGGQVALGASILDRGPFEVHAHRNFQNGNYTITSRRRQ